MTAWRIQASIARKRGLCVVAPALNAREAMHLVELRSGREGHPTYRAVAHEMHRLIAEAHPAVGAAMTHVDHEREPRLERILSEIRSEAKARARAAAARP